MTVLRSDGTPLTREDLPTIRGAGFAEDPKEICERVGKHHWAIATATNETNYSMTVWIECETCGALFESHGIWQEKGER